MNSKESSTLRFVGNPYKIRVVITHNSPQEKSSASMW
jgi:hypothetical protein